MKLFFAALVALTIFRIAPLHADVKPSVKIGFDGAYGVKGSTSAQAIELGARAAIFEINENGGVLGGRPLELVTKDNRSVPSRGVDNLIAFSNMTDLVAVLGGRFSPVLLQQLQTVHELKMPLLNVWGAADGITQHDYSPSYTFRLSLRDSWAMPRMIDAALEGGAKKIGVLLPNTGWGRSNLRAVEANTAARPELDIVSQWYNWGETDMLQHYQQLLGRGADALVFVANDIEASLLVRQLGEFPATKRIPIISHWGITGGEMFEKSGSTLSQLDVSVVQTFSFARANPDRRKIFSDTVKKMDGIDDVSTLDSPVGVGHAYDMVHILAKAIEAADSTDRARIRDALEGDIMYDGLVRNYRPAFSKTSHDALSPEQVFMARFNERGIIEPVK